MDDLSITPLTNSPFLITMSFSTPFVPLDHFDVITKLKSDGKNIENSCLPVKNEPSLFLIFGSGSFPW